MNLAIMYFLHLLTTVFEECVRDLKEVDIGC
jgi:hypothetical protein